MTMRAHVITAVAGVLMTVFILRLVGRQQLKSKYALLWLFTGLLVLPLAFFPTVLDTLSRWVGVSYGPTTFLLAAIGFLLLIVIHLSRELTRVETNLRAVAEEVAVMRATHDLEIALATLPDEHGRRTPPG
jgi:hypothetical protein